MDIILLERVGNLGKIGDVVTVKDGYARNYLLPNKKALRANDYNKKVFEENRYRLEKENEEKRVEAAKEGEKLDGMTIELIRQASNTGQLYYGSVTVRDIVTALEAKGETVSKRQIVLERPIKAIGMHEVSINLHAEVDVTVKVNVARSPEEAERQAEGVDVIAEMFEKEQAEIAVAELSPERDGESEKTKADGESAEAEGDDAAAEAAEAGDASSDEAEAEDDEEPQVEDEASDQAQADDAAADDEEQAS